MFYSHEQLIFWTLWWLSQLACLRSEDSKQLCVPASSQAHHPQTVCLPVPSAWKLSLDLNTFPVSEYDALYSLFNATNGEDWDWRTPYETHGFPWQFTTAVSDPCTDNWQGITCSENPKSVTSLILEEYHLVGSLPASIVNLTNLEVLSLDYNLGLVSSIPESMGNLANLIELALIGNRMSGSIPASLGNLTQLQVLSLYSNELSDTIPASLGNLAQLQVLSLYSNELSGTIPASLGNLAQLQVLSLYSNELSGTIPASLGNLAQLQVLDLNSNELSDTIPASLGNLTQLQFLGLNSNELSGTIPASLGNLTQLQVLSLYSNELSGIIPASLGNLAQLQYLDLYSNELSGTIPASLGNLAQLQYLYLDSNELSGTIPASLGNLAQLQVLDLYSNELSGAIPASLGNLTQLQVLDLNSNELSGTIPASLGNLTQLQFLGLYSNELSVTIPASLGNLAQLQVLSLYSNELSGTIPASLGNLAQLQYLNLDSNELSGTIPASLGNLAELQVLDLYSNELSGTIPASLGNLTQLQDLDLYSNELSGTIPAILGNLAQLQVLDLNSNELSDTIPASLGNLARLQVLSLYSNELSGTIPAILGNLARLQDLDLYSNELSGTIPASLNNLAQLLYLYLDSNELSGAIPLSLDSLPYLVDFFANDNQFTGSLYSLFGVANQTELAKVVMHNNQFTGTLPSELFVLPNLVTVVLTSNCFSGTLPASICTNSVLQSMIMDGLSSGSFCRKLILPKVLSSSYRVNNFMQGTIPSCLFTDMPSLSTLQMSGNGLRGSLPDEVNAALVDLSVSHNLLTGSIPSAFQEHAWYNLDLSYNRLDGTLQSGLMGGALNLSTEALQKLPIADGFNDSNLALENNLLSGDLPSSILSLRNVSVLGSNVFSCAYDQHNLPTHDQGRDTYECGSNTFNVLYYIWLVIWGVLSFVYMCIVWLVCRNLGSVKVVVAKWVKFAAIVDTAIFYPDMSNHGSLAEAVEMSGSIVAHSNVALIQQLGPLRDKFQNEMHRVWVAVQWVLQLALLCTLFIVILLVPFYIAASLTAGSMTHEYAWTVSAAYLEGLTVVVVIETCLLLLVPVVVIAFVLYSHSHLSLDSASTSTSTSGMTQEQRSPQASNEDSSHGDDAENGLYVVQNQPSGTGMEQYVKRFMVICLNVLVVAAANAGYVYAVLNADGTVQTAVQLLISAFKVMWNSVMINALVNYVEASSISKNGNTSNDTTNHNHSHSSTVDRNNSNHTGSERSGLFQLQLFIVLLNHILIPCLTVACISPNCFKELFVAPDEISAPYVYYSCNLVLDNGYCISTRNVGTTSYTPPFIYGYNCSSSFITYYAPAYMYVSILGSFVIPVLQMGLSRLYGNAVDAKSTSASSSASSSSAGSSSRWEWLLQRLVPPILHPMRQPTTSGIPDRTDAAPVVVAAAAVTNPMVSTFTATTPGNTTTTTTTGDIDAKLSTTFAVDKEDESIACTGTAIDTSGATTSAATSAACTGMSASYMDVFLSNTHHAIVQQTMPAHYQATSGHVSSPIAQQPTSTPPATANFDDRTYFDSDKLLKTLLMYVGLIITYGAVFPPLAVAFIMTLLSLMMWSKLKLGRFVSMAMDLEQWHLIERIIRECRSTVSISVLQDACWMLIVFCCCFYTLFLFDLVGSKSGLEDAVWVFLVVPMFPVYLYILVRLSTYLLGLYKRYTYAIAIQAASDKDAEDIHLDL